MTTHEDAREGQDCGYEPNQSPERLGKPAESAEVKIRQPKQSYVSKLNLANCTRGLKEAYERIEHLWKGEVYSRDSPHQNK
jgi:hypothetical protein